MERIQPALAGLLQLRQDSEFGFRIQLQGPIEAAISEHLHGQDSPTVVKLPELLEFPFMAGVFPALGSLVLIREYFFTPGL